MKKLFISSCSLLSLLLMAFLLSYCGRPDAVNTMEEIEAERGAVPLPLPGQLDSSSYGTYRGVLPCEQCGAKQVELSLHFDDTYTYKEIHLDEIEKICTHSGEIKYYEEKKMIRLPKEGDDIQFELLENSLHLLDNSNQKVVTEVSQSPFLYKSQLDLQMAIWIVGKIGGEKFPKEVYMKTHMQFNPDGSYTYTGGCNRCKGIYKTISGEDIYIKPAACTKKLCEGEDIDQAIGNALKEAAKYKVERRNLVISNRKGEVIMELQSLL